MNAIFILRQAAEAIGYVAHDDPEKKRKLAAVHCLHNAQKHLQAWRSELWDLLD